MARIEADIPTEWDKVLNQIRSERQISKRQLVKDAVYEKYIQAEKKDKQ